MRPLCVDGLLNEPNRTGEQMSISIHGTNGITFNDGSTQTTRPAVGFRNRIINGDMRIWQRGTTISNPTTSNFYTADRWGVNRNSDISGATVSRDISGLSGFEYSLKLQRTAGNTNTGSLALWYSNESTNTYDLVGSPVTLSFWAKKGANYSGGLLTVQVVSGTGTDQRIYAYTGGAAVINTTQAITSAWTRYSFTGTVPANATELGLMLQWEPTGTAGADDSVYITGVQLEQGSTATEFERRPISAELALCQRYFNRYGGVTSASGYAGIASGVAASSTQAEVVSFLPVAMRSSPTISFSGTISVYDGTVRTLTSIVSTYDSSQKTAVYYAVGASGGGLTAGRGAILWANNASTSFLDFNSEL